MENSTLEITSRLEKIFEELKIVRAENEKLRRELSGGVTLSGEQTGLAENNSLKQVLEEILFEMKATNANMKEFMSHALMTTACGKASKTTNNVMLKTTSSEFWECGDDQENNSRPKYAVVDIPFKTRDDWQLFWSEEIQKSKKRLRTLVEGTSIKENASRENVSCVFLELGNYSPCGLKKGQCFPSENEQKMPNEISPSAKECGLPCSLFNPDVALFSYDVISADVRLILRVATYSYYGFDYGIAFIPTKTPIDDKLLTEQDLFPTMTLNFTRDFEPKLIQYKDLLATAKYDVNQNIFYVELIKLYESHLPASKILDMKPVADGYTWRDYMPTINSLSEQDQVGCIIEIENRLNTALEDFKYYIPTASQFVLLPPAIPSFFREMFFTSDAKTVKGMFSYLMQETDLRVAVVFCASSQGNYFSIGFISALSETDKNTLDSLSGMNGQMGPSLWSTANYGERTLDFRNLRVTASMTTDSKAILKVVITAY